VQVTIIQRRPAVCLFLSRESFLHPQILKSTEVVCKPPFPNARGICRSIVKRNVLHAWRLSRKCRIIRSRSYRKCVGPHCKYCVGNSLVRALSLNVAGLLALVASTLAAGLGGAVSGEMTNFTAVVALLTLGAVT